MNTSQNILTGSIALMLLAIMGTGMTFAADYEERRGQGHGEKRGQMSENYSQETTPLTESEKTLLIYGQQEERLARDVYLHLFEKYELETFQNISTSENKHMDAIGRILERNNIPETTGYGELQSTYDALIAKGDISLKDAIEVGITIEILDIEDLDKTLAETNNQEIIRVYENLRRGSINHLNAYVAQLQNNNFETDLNWEKFTNQEEVSKKIECLNMSPEEKEEHKKEHKSEKRAGEKSEYSSDKVRGRENGQGKNRDERVNKRTQNSEKIVQNIQKAEKYQKFSGELQEKKNFSDAGKIRNKNAVEFLQQRGILGGYADGSFKPENSINRAESIKVLLEALGEKPSTGELGREFSDVHKDDWFAGYVKKAKENGVVKGYEDGSFRPTQTVNQAELLKIAFQSFGINLSGYAVSTLPNNADTNAWYAVYLQYAVDHDLLDTQDVNPEKNMTRDSFSEFVYRLIQQQEAL